MTRLKSCRVCFGLLALLLVFSTSPLWAQKSKELSGNPVFPGWYADPEVILYGDTYWIFPTYSAPYEQQIVFDCFSSKDLVNWTKHERILDNKEVKWANRAMWAPSIIEKDGKYYLFFGANDVHPDQIGGIGVAVAEKPQGPYKDLLGKPLVNDIVNGAQPIDQFVFKDVDGSYYMIYGGWRHCNIVKLKDDFTGLVPFDDGEIYKEITPEGYVEGPCVFLRNGKYYFMWSEGGWTGPNYNVAYAISDSILGPHKRIGKIIEPDTTVGMGAGHHSVLHLPKLDKWYVVYHRRPLGETAAEHRVTCIEEMYFNEDGTIKPVPLTFEGVVPQKAGGPLNKKMPKDVYPEAFKEKTILPTANEKQTEWKYTLEEPAKGWEQSNFNDKSWKAGKSGFGGEEPRGVTVGTPWTTSDIWLRTSFQLDKADLLIPEFLVVNMFHDEDAAVYVNGKRILDVKGFTQQYRFFTPRDPASAFKVGRNTLAVHCKQTDGGQYIDLGISRIPTEKRLVTVIIEPDVRNEHVEAWAAKSRELIEEWYPKLSERLASPGFRPTREIRLRFKKMDGVAYAAGTEIVVSTDWITRAPNDHGLIVHELTHIIQSYRHRVPGWVVEGIADYIRFFLYEKPAIPRVTESSKYTDSYRVTGAFFNWIVVNHDEKFITKLNAVCREGKYSDGFFKEVTGKTLDELWADYAKEAMSK